MNRLQNIPGFSIDQVANAAGNDPDVLRMENLDTDLRPPEVVLEATRNAVGRDDDNSYLPFTGRMELRQAVAEKLQKETKLSYEANNVVITCGGTEGLLDALLAVTNPGDEVILTDPTYAGMIYRVRLAGGVPKLVPFVSTFGEWRLDLDALRQAVTPKTKAIFIMNPSMPSGAVLNLKEWEAIAGLCRERNLWLLYNAAMERILYDHQKVVHPATLFDMSERVITIGSVSKEYRMIGWRVGWVVAPKSIINEIAKAHIYNTVTPVGISQMGAAAALKMDENDIAESVQVWEARRNVVNEQLKNYNMIPAAGGWSQLLDVTSFGMTAEKASELLLQKGKIAVTHMTHWGEQNSEQFVRLVFSNESVERLQTLGERSRRTFGSF